MDFDILVIGSGAGGGMTALRLCEAGFKVGLIERGPRFDPRHDYIQNHTDWERRSDPLDLARRQEQTIDRSYLTKFSVNGRPRTRGALNYHRTHGVGGSTLQYQGEAHRFADHAFTTKTYFGWGADWPISYDDLAPYYSSAEKMLGVAGITGNPFKRDRERFPTPAHPLSAKSKILAKAAARAGFSLQPNTLALPSSSVNGRTPCQHSGGCNYGCIFAAKSSIDQAVIPIAEASGNLTLLTHTRALGLACKDKGQIDHVQCIGSQGPLSLSAKRYVLATGALETPRLMLASKNNAMPKGFANSQDQVGRYFMETVVATCFFTLDDDLKTYGGPPLDARVWDFCRPIDNNTNGFVLGAAGYLQPETGPSNHAIRTPGIGREHIRTVKNTFGRNLYVFGVAEQEPIASNRVSLSNKLDDQGIAKVKVHCAYSTRDIHTLKMMQTKLQAWVNATPSSGIYSSSNTLYQSAATHVAGTCRMGVDPDKSVVDAYGKVHGSTNCFIADGSVMPTQGAGDSPSLTIQALALRTADKIIDELS